MRSIFAVLVLSSFAFAQTTTTTIPGGCNDLTQEELDIVVRGNPTTTASWNYIQGYMSRRHYTTDVCKKASLCTTNGNVAYICVLANQRSGGPDAIMRYIPGISPADQVQVTFLKGSRTYFELGPMGGTKVTLDPSGNVVSVKLLNGQGKSLHPPTTVVDPLTKRRHL